MVKAWNDTQVDDVDTVTAQIWNDLVSYVTSRIAAPASPEQGDILYYNGSAYAVLHHGTSGQVLQTKGHAANPEWADSTGGSGDEVLTWMGI